ncbi:hypothetical protein QYE76_067858 [Lolium multiflorum]|uniref:RRM domain-containing protein n=1 Tax=Lolium multiflorum TaxID=4521 RepID=A0AAD8SF48_LOLMU|nr:hypothetical protein QYE76_067858 [Lolium multiflorum]
MLTRKDLEMPWWKNHKGFIQLANHRQGSFLNPRLVSTMNGRTFVESRRKKRKVSPEIQVQEKLPKRTRVASFDMAHDVEHDQVKKVFTEAGEVISFDFYRYAMWWDEAFLIPSSDELFLWTAHLSLGCEQAWQKRLVTVQGPVVYAYSAERYGVTEAIYRLTGLDLMGRPLKLQWLSLNIQALGRDLPSPGKNLPVHLRMTICVKAFDSSLDVETIRSILKEHFECHGRLKTLNTPVNSDNTSTGKAYVRFASLIAFRSALKLHGSILRGHKLCVTEWPEFPWYREERSKTISEGDAGLAGQHAANASSGTQELLHATTRNTPIPLKLLQSSCEVPVLQKGPNWHTASRGKRTVFMESNDD